MSADDFDFPADPFADAPAPADDASGAEAMREAWAYAIVNAQGKRTGVIHADRSRLVPIVEADNADDLAGGPFRIVPLAPLPARDDAVERARDYDAMLDWLDERVGDGRGEVRIGLTDNGGVGCWLPGDETVPEGESVEEAIRFRMERLAAERAAREPASGKEGNRA